MIHRRGLPILGRTPAVVLLAATLGGCASVPVPAAPAATQRPPIPVPGTPGASRTPDLPAIPAVDGDLRLEVGYPARNALITARDSNFIFGSTGSGRTQLTINDIPVPVAPNGGFLAFLPVPPDGVYRLHASRAGQVGSLDHTVRVPPPPVSAVAGAGVVAAYPTGAWAVQAGELIEVGFRGPPGAQAALLLPTGERIALVQHGAILEAATGAEFRTDAPAPQRVAALVRYSAMVPVRAPLLSRDTALARPRIGMLRGASGGAATGAMAPRPPAGAAAPAASTGEAVVEVVAGTDTARAPLRLNVAVLATDLPRVGVATAPANAPHDWTVRGRNEPAGPFHYFWPAGTRLTITGERDGMYRVRLAGDRTAWVPVGDVRLQPEGAALPGGPIPSARFAPQPQHIDLRIPAPDRLPFQVVVEGARIHIDVFGATSHANFFQYGALDPLLTYAEWRQVADGIFRVSMHLAEPVWGWHAWYEAGGALVLRVRRPPRLDPAAPLRGLVIGVDPGHGGADRATRGPTGLTEADANLFISLRLQDLLLRAGARVMMTRTTDETVGLGDRPRMAADSGVHILVSVHNNAFPDGVNPWVNAGTSTYYYHPHSAGLARWMQHELLEELGLRDIGYGRADLALVRPTWMPAVLTETMFMMIPEQEAALADAGVQERIARAHLRALERFLREHLGHQR
jgi:N-acetylmuramoyl-L-alanine amidase